MSDNDAAPIAWVRANGNVVMHTSKRGWYVERKPNGDIAAEPDCIPFDAIPLVPATERDDLRDALDVAEHRVSDLSKKPRKLLALDSIEALRFAADVCDQHNRSLGRDWHQHPFPPRELRERIRDLEREAEVDSRRDERAQELHLAYIDGTTGIGLKWELLTDGQRNGWRAVADHLDPTQAKAVQ